MAEVSTDLPESRTLQGAAELHLDAAAVTVLRERLPGVAEEVVAAIIEEVPSYTGALSGRMGDKIRMAVHTAFSVFVDLIEGASGRDVGSTLGAGAEPAYELGRGEARNGRSMDALLAAYRVGARVSWRRLADTVVEYGVHADTVSKFAQLVFSYIDELSAASATGHADELAISGRARERHLETLTHDLLTGAPEDVLLADAERAGWAPPDTLTAVLVPSAHARRILHLLDPRTLLAASDLPDLSEPDEMSALLVPDVVDGAARGRLVDLVRERKAVVGPARPWAYVRASYLRTVRAMEQSASSGNPVPTDTDRYLVELILGADPDAYADLRERALAPLKDVKPAAALRLEETLRAWLLHQGRRDDVAAELFVHAQTVRYRMGQLRDLFGDDLGDPRRILELTLALGVARQPGTSPHTG